MTPENFVYWLQGYLELTANPYLNVQQVAIIQEHISLVLTKKTVDIPVYLRGGVTNMNEPEVTYMSVASC